MRTYLFIGGLALVVILIVFYVIHNSNSQKEQMALLLNKHSENAANQNTGNLLEFVTSVVPSLYSQFSQMKGEKEEKKEEPTQEIPFLPLQQQPTPFVGQQVKK